MTVKVHITTDTGGNYTLKENEDYIIFDKNTQAAKVEIKKAIPQSNPEYYYDNYFPGCSCTFCTDARVKATDYSMKELKNNINKTLVGQMNDFYGYQSIKPNESKPPDFFDYLQKSYEKLSNIEKILLQQNQEPEEDPFENDDYENCECSICVKAKENGLSSLNQLLESDLFKQVLKDEITDYVDFMDEYQEDEEFNKWLETKIKQVVGPLLSASNENLKEKSQKWTNPQELFKWFITDHRVQEYIEQGVKDYFLAMIDKSDQENK